MNKCVNSINAYNINTQRVIRLVSIIHSFHPKGNYIISLGIDYPPKKNAPIANTAIKIFDSRTLDIISYPRKFDSTISSLSMVDGMNYSFLVSNIDGDCSIYSLANGLMELNHFHVCD